MRDSTGLFLSIGSFFSIKIKCECYTFILSSALSWISMPITQKPRIGAQTARIWTARKKLMPNFTSTDWIINRTCSRTLVNLFNEQVIGHMPRESAALWRVYSAVTDENRIFLDVLQSMQIAMKQNKKVSSSNHLEDAILSLFGEVAMQTSKIKTEKFYTK